MGKPKGAFIHIFTAQPAHKAVDSFMQTASDGDRTEAVNLCASVLPESYINQWRRFNFAAI